MSAEAAAPVQRSGRSIVWTRRRRAFARNWKQFRRDREGLIGLILLAFFAFLALAGPWLVDPESTASSSTGTSTR